MASRDEIRAVRKVIYDRDLRRKLNTQLDSIRVLMKVDDEGPTWVYPANGQPTVAVLDAAERCDKIAALLRKTRRRLADVDIDRSDKSRLRDGFAQLAQAWERRGAVWRAPSKPDVEAEAAAIAEHERAAFRKFKRAPEYFEDGQ